MVNVSDPIVPFRETIIWPPVMDEVNEAIDGQAGDSASNFASNNDPGDSPCTTTSNSQNENSKNDDAVFKVMLCDVM